MTKIEKCDIIYKIWGCQVFDTGGEAKGSGTQLTAEYNTLADALFGQAAKRSLAEQLFCVPVSKVSVSL